MVQLALRVLKSTVGVSMLLLAFGVSLARADVAPKWSLNELVDFSEVVVSGRVVRVASGFDATVQTPYTYVTLDVGEVLKGSVPVSQIVLKQIGGEYRGEQFVVLGQPSFVVGEEVVAFLEVRPRDQTLYTTALWQGKWNVSADAVTGRRIVTRRQPSLTNGLDWFTVAGFNATVRGRAREDISARSSQTLRWRPAETPTGGSEAGSTVQPFTLMGPARWNEADSGAAIPIDVQAGGQPGLAGGGATQVFAGALQWNNTGSTMRWSAGSTSAAGGCSEGWPSGKAAITFMDPCGEMSNSGGTLAIGGFYYTSSGGKTVNGQAFNRITRGGIVNNDSAAALNFLTNSGCFAAVELHELGHVLGLGHSADSNAVMYPFINNACFQSGIGLQSDDATGIRFIYPASGEAPGVPVGLTATVAGSTLTLRWTAGALTLSPVGTPSAYIIEAGSASALSDLANFSTGNAGTTFVAQSVPAGIYYLRVRATNAAGTSAASNQVVATIGGASAPPGAPSGVTTTVTGSNIVINWVAPTTGGAPAAYIIQAGSSAGLSNLANFSTGNTATSFAAGGIGAGTYFLRVLATNAVGTSGPSNEAILIVR